MPLARIDSHAVTGVVSPQTQEAMIREVWATVSGGVVSTARKLIGTIVLAPLGWMVLAPFWAMRFLGFMPGLSFLTTKYTLTNRRLMIRKGMKARPVQEIPLDRIGEVRTLHDGNTDFYGIAGLEVRRLDGSVAFTLPGVPEPESFRQAIIHARDAWGPYLKTQ